MTALNAHRRTLRIVASQLRPGDRIVRAGARDHRAHQIIVSATRTRGASARMPHGISADHVAVWASTLSSPTPALVFPGLHPDLPIVIERDA